MTAQNEDKNFYEIILREVREGKKSVDSVMEMFKERIENEDRLHAIRFEMLKSVGTEIEALRKNVFDVADAKTIALQNRKDIEEHKDDHRWWWKSLISAATVLSTTVAWIVSYVVKHSENISQWFHKLNDYGKPPHP